MNNNALIGKKNENLFKHSIRNQIEAINAIRDTFKIKGTFLNAINTGTHGEKVDVKMEFSCGRNIDVNIKSYKQSKAAYNQLTRTSVHNFCTTFSLPHIHYLQHLVIHKAKDTKSRLIPIEEQTKIHAILQPISKQMVKWALSNKVARELLVLYESEEKKIRIYKMKKLLQHLTYPIHFTKRGNIAIGNYIIIQRKGGNGSLSKTIPKASIKHPGNNIQLKIKLKPFVQGMQQHELISYTI